MHLLISSLIISQIHGMSILYIDGRSFSCSTIFRWYIYGIDIYIYILMWCLNSHTVNWPHYSIVLMWCWNSLPGHWPHYNFATYGAQLKSNGQSSTKKFEQQVCFKISFNDGIIMRIYIYHLDVHETFKRSMTAMVYKVRL